MERQSWAVRARRVSVRLSTIEGWREAGSNSIDTLWRISVRIVAVDPKFDPECYLDECPSPLAKVGTIQALGSRPSFVSSGWSTRPRNPFDDSFTIRPGENGGEHDPFDDSNALALDDGQSKRPESQQPYHVFSKGQKRLLVAIIGLAGLFSGLSSNIYFPAQDLIARDLQVSLNMVSLTITSYLIIQGISPVIWGSLSDALGRRPIYIASFILYIIANIALSFSPNFTILVIFRGLQAAGSASTVSIGNGVIQDVSPPSERGAYISFYQAIRNFSIAAGPVLGGVLANFLGFRSIFVFLLILSGFALTIIVVFLPETMRSIAGDGSLRLGGIYQPVLYKIKGEPRYMRDSDTPVTRKSVTLGTFIEPLKLLTRKDILLNLIFGGVVYAIWSMVTASTTGLFKSNFGLNELLLGLAFLPNGFGTIVGSAIAGQLMTRDFSYAEAAYKSAHNLPPTYRLSVKSLPADFPIEHARLRNLPWITGVFVFATAAYGFSLASPATTSLRGWIAVPLTLQFFIAAASNAVFALNQTLIADLCPGRGASSTAVNNLVRCGLGAVGVALVEMMIDRVGSAPAFLGLALVTVIFVPLVVMNWYWGMQWRVTKMGEREALVEKV